MKKILALCLCLILLLSSACAKKETRRYRAEFLTLFNTVTTIIGYAESEDEFLALAEKVRASLAEYHELYDIYKDYEGISNIKTINDSAGKAPVKADGRIISMLEYAKLEYEKTEGRVNVAMGSVLEIWHEYREEGTDDPENAKLPPKDLLREAAGHTDINNVIIDRAASTVFLSDPDMRLDVGAIAKGYAVERVAEGIEKMGVKSMIISVGGNIRAIGGKLEPGSDGDRRWSVSLQNPDKQSEDGDLMSLMIEDLSIVSSGVYERYYTVEGVEYHHIIDPATLMPSSYFAQLTIVCRDSGLADALSTAVFNMPLAEGREYIEALEGVEALWVMKDGSMEFSSGFKDYIKVSQ